MKFSESIKKDGKLITGMDNIREEIEIFWGNIGKGGSSGNFRYTCNIELINGWKNIEMGSCSPSMIEIRETLKKLKNNKGVGLDGISYEFYKNGGVWMVRALHILYMKVWDEEVVPLKWNELLLLTS